MDIIYDLLISSNEVYKFTIYETNKRGWDELGGWKAKAPESITGGSSGAYLSQSHGTLIIKKLKLFLFKL